MGYNKKVIVQVVISLVSLGIIVGIEALLFKTTYDWSKDKIAVENPS